MVSSTFTDQGNRVKQFGCSLIPLGEGWGEGWRQRTGSDGTFRAQYPLSTRQQDPHPALSQRERGFLVGFTRLPWVMDWFSRRVLSWLVSITLEVEFCLEAVEEALARHGKLEIFNTDQGSQFTSADFTGLLLANAIAISMDGRGAWRDNVFVERLWRSVKYEEVYLRAYDSVAEARASIGRYLAFYNRKRPHSSLGARTPEQATFDDLPLAVAA